MWDDINHDLLLNYKEEACKKAHAESNKKYRASKRQRISNDEQLRIITNQLLVRSFFINKLFFNVELLYKHHWSNFDYKLIIYVSFDSVLQEKLH